MGKLYKSGQRELLFRVIINFDAVQQQQEAIIAENCNVYIALAAASWLMLATSSYQLRVDNLEDILVYPLEAPKKVRKRGVSPVETRSAFEEFVESKLIQQSQALEHLLRMVSTTSILTKRLLELCCNTRQSPSMPDSVKLGNFTATRQLQNTRRSYSDDSEFTVSTENNDTDGPLERLGKKIPLYGNFVKNLAVKQFSSKSEPQVIVEPVYNLDLLKKDGDNYYVP